MERPEIALGDFIRLNSSSFNNMKQQAPEVADAFAKVLAVVATRYAKAPIPTQKIEGAKFEIGDIVEITGIASRYPKYQDMFKKMGFANVEINDNGRNGDIGEVFGVDKDTINRTIYGVRFYDKINNEFEVLISEDGLKMVNPIKGSLDVSKIGKIENMPKLLIFKDDAKPQTYEDVEFLIKQINERYGLTGVDKWRLPTAVEMSLINSGLEKGLKTTLNKFLSEDYWIDKKSKIYSTLFMKVYPEGNDLVPTDRKYPFRLVQGEYDQSKLKTQTTSGVKQTIETYPEYLSIDFRIADNVDDRKGPTQSAGDLKRNYNSTQYQDEILNTYFKGNDGDWYKLNIGKGGTWTWKKEDLPASATQSTSSVNREYNLMSQTELQKLKRDTEAAMSAFEPEDDEYKELEQQLEEIEIYID